jgi:hypothetical protein
MCRSIKTLFNFQPAVTEEEIRAASLQFVRKLSGFNKPSKANEAAFLTGRRRNRSEFGLSFSAHSRRIPGEPRERRCQCASARNAENS